jgi:F-type H+-transporting ATPase subunit epsilon
MNKLNIEIISPRGSIFNKEVDFFSLPGEAGEIGLLAGHSPFLSTLKQGEIFVKDHGKVIKHYFIAEGFLQVTEHKATVVVEYADTTEEIKLDEELRKKKEIEHKLKDNLTVDERYFEILALEKAIMRIEMKQQQKTE